MFTLGLYPINVGESVSGLVGGWVRPSVAAEGMIMSSATVQMTCSGAATAAKHWVCCRQRFSCVYSCSTDNLIAIQI